MELKVFDNYHLLSHAAATRIVGQIRKKPDALLCFASGDTPKLAYQLAAEMVKSEQVDVTQCYFIGLDEWLGITPDNTGSCHYFLQRYLIQPMNIPAARVHLFNATLEDEEAECTKMDRLIAERGGIDLAIVGVGMNGHIGFNEPGTSTQTLAHVISLDEITKQVGQKYFTETTAVNKGITVGLKQLLHAKELLLMANGLKKAGVMKRVVEGEASKHFPASLIRQHQNGTVMIDSEAASELETQYQ